MKGGVVAIVLATTMLAAGGVRAGPSSTRTVLLYDNSGSMRTSDPSRLAAAAALLYVRLAKKHDRVGLVVFDDDAKVVEPIRRGKPRRSRFKRKLARLRRDGATTHIGRALEVGLGALGPPRKGVKDVVVLLTDGRVDLGRARKAELPAERGRIRTELVDAYRERGVPLYTIAFTDASDRGLMEELAGRTNGAFRYIENARDLHRAFSDLFVVASGTSSLPIRDGAVVVDSSVNRTSLVMSKVQPGDRNTVVAPDEEVLSQDSLRRGMKWKSSSSYDHVELKSPQAGAWQMKGADGKPPEAMALIQDSSLELKVRFGPKDATVDDVLEFVVELIDKGKRVQSFRRLKSMSVEAQVEDSQRNRRTILFKPGQEAGLYVGKIGDHGSAGQHSVVVTAISPALQRQWKGNFTIRPPCFQSKVKVEDPQPVAMVRLGPDCPTYKKVKVEVARHLDKASPVWRAAKLDKETGIYARVLKPLEHGEDGVARIRVSAKTSDGYVVKVEPEPVRLPKAKGGDWSVVGLRLAYINIPLFGFLGLAYLVVRLMRSDPELDDD